VRNVAGETALKMARGRLVFTMTFVAVFAMPVGAVTLTTVNAVKRLVPVTVSMGIAAAGTTLQRELVLVTLDAAVLVGG
jgi:hypothetical protein